MGAGLDFLKAYGEGPFELRLVVEGWPVEWLTDGMEEGEGPAPALGVPGALRIRGLSRKGLKVSERIGLKTGMPKLSGFRAMLLDHDGTPFLELPYEMSDASNVGNYIGAEGFDRVTASLTAPETTAAFVTENVGIADTNWTVSDTSALVEGRVYAIGTEAVYLNVISGANQIQVVRGLFGSTAQAHWVGEGEDLAYPEMTDYPTMMRGRRVWLYLHGPTELGRDQLGSFAWKGVVGDEPVPEGDGAWTILVDPPDKLLEQSVAGKSRDPLRLRGAYYSSTGSLLVYGVVLAGNSAYSSDTADGFAFTIQGFFADQAAFLAAVNAQLATLAGAFSGIDSFRAEGNGDDWWITVQMASSGARYVRFNYGSAGSMVDGLFAHFLMEADGTGPALSVSNGTSYRTSFYPEDELFRWLPAETVDRLRGPTSTSTRSGVGWRATPRACYDEADPRTVGPPALTEPSNRIYISDPTRLEAGDTVAMGEHVFEVDSVDTATGAVDLVDPETGGDADLRGLFGILLRDGGVEIRASRNYGSGTIADFVSTLTLNGAELGNLGTFPFILPGDFGTVAIGGLATLPVHTTRRYSFVSPKKLRDVFEQEMLVYGTAMHLDATGALAISPFSAPRATGRSSSVHVGQDPDDRVASGDRLADVQYAPEGYVNVVEQRVGWNLTEEEFDDLAIRVRWTNSISRLKNEHVLEIAPEVPVETDVRDEDELRQIATPYLALLGRRYGIVSVPVGFKHFDVLCVDSVKLTHPQLRWNGVRGVEDANALVVGRQWDFENGTGALELMLHAARFVGYSPSARVEAAAGAGTSWTLTTFSNWYGDPAEGPDAGWFEVGDRVEVWQLEQLAPVRYQGVVTSRSGVDLVVEFDQSFPGLGSGVWNVAFGSAVEPAIQDAQRDFGYLADEGFLIDDEERAQELGP